MLAPVLTFVGHSNSGKTTLIGKIILELTKRRYVVDTIKHVPAHLIFSDGERDSDRRLASGSPVAVVNSQSELISFERQSRKTT